MIRIPVAFYGFITVRVRTSLLWFVWIWAGPIAGYRTPFPNGTGLTLPALSGEGSKIALRTFLLQHAFPG